MARPRQETQQWPKRKGEKEVDNGSVPPSVVVAARVNARKRRTKGRNGRILRLFRRARERHRDARGEIILRQAQLYRYRETYRL